MRKLLTVIMFALALWPTYTMAQNASPYVVGQWNLDDKLKDFKESGGSPIITDDTAFTFLNPTPLTLTLEYAFFASDGTF